LRGQALRRGLGSRRRILRRSHPSHRAESADIVDISDLEPPEAKVSEVGPLARLRMAIEISCARDRLPVVGHACGASHECDALTGQGIVGPIRGRHEETRARIGLEVLRVNGHGTDEKEWRPLLVQRVGHHGAEGMTCMPARDGREHARGRKLHKLACALGIARLRRSGDSSSAPNEPLNPCTRATMPAAARNACRQAVSAPLSTPKSAMTPSPVYWFAMPPASAMAPPTASK